MATDSQLDAAAGAVAAALRTGSRPDLPPDLDDHVELSELIDELVTLRRFVLALSCGDLGQSLQSRGSMAGALKNPQVTLRHLTWQTQRVAAGDFSQRVDCMGEFSEAFNSMVGALVQARDELAERNQQLLAQARELEEMATHAVLTGLLNRRSVDELIENEAGRARRYGQRLSLIMLNIDPFERVNDLQGHVAGDEMLASVASIPRDTARETDSVMRWGGEEFVVLLPYADEDGAVDVAERLRVAVKSSELARGLTVSCGVAEHHPPESPDELLARADWALLRAKKGGRDRVEVAGWALETVRLAVG